VESAAYDTVTRADKNRIVTEYKGRLKLGTGNLPSRAGYTPLNSSLKEQETWSVDASGKRLTLITKVRSMQSPLIAGAKTAGSGNPYHQDEGATPTAQWGSSKLVFHRI